MLIQRGLPPSVAGERASPVANVQRGSSRPGEAEPAIKNGKISRCEIHWRDDNLIKEYGGGGSRRCPGALRRGKGYVPGHKRGRVVGTWKEQMRIAPNRSERHLPASATQKNVTHAAARSAGGNSPPEVTDDTVHENGKDRELQQELLWSSHFFLHSSISAGCLLGRWGGAPHGNL